jgi:molecular chaperone DnaJ
MSSRPPTHPSRRSLRRFPAACCLLVLTLALLFASAAAKSSRRPISVRLPAWSCHLSASSSPSCTLLIAFAKLAGAGQRDPAEEGGLLHRRREVRVTMMRSVLFSVSDAMFLCSNDCVCRLRRSGLWGWVCRSSPTEKENCVLRCLSPECYDLIYGGDPVSFSVWVCGSRGCCLQIAMGALVADFCLGLFCSLKKASWIMSVVRSTSTACTSKNNWNIWMYSLCLGVLNWVCVVFNCWSMTLRVQV